MKRILTLTAIFTAALFLGACVGCKPIAAPQPLAPGYYNLADQQIGGILSGARSFYTTIQMQSASGVIVLTAAQKAAFNIFGSTLNGAEAAYLSYHQNPTATLEAAAQTQANQVQSQQATLPLPQVAK